MPRREERQQTSVPARIEANHSVTPAQIVDISRYGIRVMAETDLGAGDEVVVHVANHTFSFRVVWVKHDGPNSMAGMVSLTQPLEWPPDLLDTISA